MQFLPLLFSLVDTDFWPEAELGPVSASFLRGVYYLSSARAAALWPGSRGGSTATARRLRQALPRRYCRHCWYFTDLWESYVGVLPRWQHRRCSKGDGDTSIVKAINCVLRQRCGVLVRKSCSFNEPLQMRNARIKIVIDKYNLTLN